MAKTLIWAVAQLVLGIMTAPGLAVAYPGRYARSYVKEVRGDDRI
jgi:hypothetical protein